MKPKRSEINKRRLVLAVIAVACFIVSFYVVGREITGLLGSPNPPLLIATMPVPALRILTINETSPDQYSDVDTLYILAADSSIYGCILGKQDPCAPAQLPAELKLPGYSTPIEPINFMLPEPSLTDSVIDFFAYRRLYAEAYTDVQINMMADRDVWQEESSGNAYGTLFVIFPLSGLTSLIITVLTVWIINRLLRRQHLSSPAIDQSAIDT